MALSLYAATPAMAMSGPTMINGPEVAATMPGLGPFGLFDPLNLTPDTQEDLLMFREAELAHGRVSMMAALGFLVQESFHPIFSASAGVDGPVIRQLDQVLSTGVGQSAGAVLLMAIFFSEIARARIGWVEPEEAMRTLREGYLPGDLKFDPLGVKPADEKEFRAMQGTSPGIPNTTTRYVCPNRNLPFP